MKPDYKNWVPVSMIVGFFSGSVVCLCLTIVFFCIGKLTVFKISGAVFCLATIGLLIAGIWMLALNRMFSYDGKRKMSKQIIDGIAEHVNIPDGGTGLDVGCGSAALSIAVAKRNPNAKVIGSDIWSGAYKAVFTKELCEKNSAAEGVKNTEFRQGNALNLPFKDESFDAVFSNYVYHNIPSKDRQSILLETLRTLKKGGTFAIHDIFSKSKYGDMQLFVQKLKDMGYEDVSLIDTTAGKFMTKKEAMWMELSGSAILTGKK